MLLPHGATVAVADGEKLNLFRNAGDEAAPQLVSLDHAAVDDQINTSGGRHHSSSANPDNGQQGEDNFAGGIADMLNTRALAGKIDDLVIIAAPRTLGELRKHYHKALSEKLRGEIAKDLTGHSSDQIAAAIEKA